MAAASMALLSMADGLLTIRIGEYAQFLIVWVQFLTAPDGSGKYGLIISSSPNVLNVFGGILSGTQVAAG